MRHDAAMHTAFDEFNPPDSAESERNLMRAILRTAMDDIQKTGAPYREAYAYLTSDDDRYLYSFLSICYHLELSPMTIRGYCGIVRMERRAKPEQMAA